MDSFKELCGAAKSRQLVFYVCILHLELRQLTLSANADSFSTHRTITISAMQFHVSAGHVWRYAAGYYAQTRCPTQLQWPFRVSWICKVLVSVGSGGCYCCLREIAQARIQKTLSPTREPVRKAPVQSSMVQLYQHGHILIHLAQHVRRSARCPPSQCHQGCKRTAFCDT